MERTSLQGKDEKEIKTMDNLKDQGNINSGHYPEIYDKLKRYIPSQEIIQKALFL